MIDGFITMDSLSKTLERFNRKERNLLVRAILGDKEKHLELSKDFRDKVADALIIDAIGADAWWATDYHYDWLAGALAVYVEGESAVQKRSVKGGVHEEKPRLNRPNRGGSGNLDSGISGFFA
jgi:hypothetical protein